MKRKKLAASRGRELKQQRTTHSGQQFTFHTTSSEGKRQRISFLPKSNASAARRRPLIEIPAEIWDTVFSFLASDDVLSSVSLASRGTLLAYHLKFKI